MRIHHNTIQIQAIRNFILKGWLLYIPCALLAFMGCTVTATKSAKPRWQVTKTDFVVSVSTKNKPPRVRASKPASASVSIKSQQDRSAPIHIYSKKALLVIMLPLSGPYAVHGQRALVAAQLALGIAPQEVRQGPFKDIIAGLPVWVIDSAGQIEQIHYKMQLLQKKASVIVGALAPQVALALAEQCQSSAIPFISLANRKDIAQVGSWIFGMPLTLQQQIDDLVRWSIHERGLYRFAILYPYNRYGKQAVKALNDSVNKNRKSEEKVVAAISYDPEETTFTLPVRKLVGLHPIERHPQYAFCQQQALEQGSRGTVKFIQAKRECIDSLRPVVNFDALLLPAVPETVSYLIPALVSQDILVSHDPIVQRQYQTAVNQGNIKPVQILGTNLWNSPQLEYRLQQSIGRLAEHMEGAVFVDGGNWEQAGSEGKRFAVAFRERVGSSPSWESRVYDAVSLAVRSLGQSTAVSAKNTVDLRHKIRISLTQNMVPIKGVTGSVSFDDSGNWVPLITRFAVRKKGIHLDGNGQ